MTTRAKVAAILEAGDYTLVHVPHEDALEAAGVLTDALAPYWMAAWAAAELPRASFNDDWVVVPRDDFEALRDALAALDAAAESEVEP